MATRAMVFECYFKDDDMLSSRQLYVALVWRECQQLIAMAFNFYGLLTKQLFQVWNSRADPRNLLSGRALPYALHDMDIYPSSSQVHEMLQCASECSKRKNADFITFGEFCVFASELQTSYDNKVPRPQPMSRCNKKELPSRKAKAIRLKAINSANNTRNSTKYQVFLGGSCNPTTWRQNTAIPFFKNLGIMSYNPQVAHWGPELIQLENQAKQNAEVMFFVIDNQTRSVASMIEAAHVAGTNRKLILIIYEFSGPGSPVLGEPITEKEFQELQQGQHYLQDLTENQDIPVFRQIQDALQATARVVQENIRVQDLTLQDVQRPVKMAHVLLAEKLGKMREIFDSLDVNNAGSVTLDDVCLAFKMVTSQELNVTQLKAIIEGQNGNLDSPVNLVDVHITFDQFCCIMTEFATPHTNSNFNINRGLASLANKVLQVLGSVVYPFSQLVDWFLESPNTRGCKDIQLECDVRDLFLGGSGDPSLWRKDIAIPMLKKRGLTYLIPQQGPWSDRLVPLETACIDKCSVLLFVITNDTRALSHMILAAHYIGKGCNVVLCIQYLKDDVIINGEKLSEQGVKDYNRGRVYLSDFANRAGVPIFEDVAEAVECGAKKCESDH